LEILEVQGFSSYDMLLFGTNNKIGNILLSAEFKDPKEFLNHPTGKLSGFYIRKALKVENMNEQLKY